MKTHHKTILAILLCFIIKINFAQTPQAIPYQAIARDNSNNPIANQNISLRFSIHDSTSSGTIVYKETQSISTNTLGLFSVNIGQGTPVTGTFVSINWSSNAKFLQVEMDAAGGANYTNMGTQQMLSVPYALHSGSSSNLPNGISNGNTLRWNGSAWIPDSTLTNKGSNVGIGNTNPNASSLLDLSSANKGFLMPRMSTSQRDAISSPAVGLQIFNTDNQCINIYDGTNWIETCGYRVSGTGPAVGTNVWTQKSNFGGSARILATGLSIGSKGYIGLGNDVINNNDFWEYDPAANTWTQKANFGGAARHLAVGFSIGSKGYVGTGYDNSIVYNDFWEYDPASNSWTQKANFGGSALAYAVGFSIGSKGYIGTGVDFGSSFHNDFWEYDPASNSWTQKANVGGAARGLAVGFSIGSKGYIGTGLDAGSNVLNDFWEYDPASNLWTQKSNFGGAARALGSGFSIGNKGYLGFGTNYISTYYNDFWEYDAAANSWTQRPNYEGGTRSHAASFSIGSKGYIGTGTSGTALLDELWEYTQEIIGNTYSTAIPAGTISTISDGAWTQNGSIIFNSNTGNVGIGTSTPKNILDVKGAAAIGNNYSGTNTAPLNGIIIEGKTGIGTSSPVNKLDVEGNVAIGANYSGANPASINGVIVEGNVGIGTIFTVNKLDVEGGAAFGSSYSGSTVAPANGIVVQGNVGIGTTLVANKLDVEGGVAIGSAYSGSSLAPVNGAIIEGRVGIGTITPSASTLLDVNAPVKLGFNGSVLTKILKGTGTTSSLMIPANTTSVQTYVIPNAATGSTVMVSPANTINPGLVIAFARISSSNVVEVSYRNTTASTITLTAGITLYISVIE